MFCHHSRPSSFSGRIFVAALLLSICSIASADWTVVKLQPPNSTHGYVYGVFGNQQVGVARPGTPDHAVIWSGSANSWIDIHPSGPTRSVLTATNGVWQGGYVHLLPAGETQNTDHASIWNGTAASWVDLHPPSFLRSEVRGMDDVFQVGDADSRAVLWSGTAASWVDLHPLAATESHAHGVHGGQQVGSARIDGTLRASLWTGSSASWVDLGDPNAVESIAFGVHNGQQVGSISYGIKSEAALWTGSRESLVILNPTGAHQSRARSVHNGEQVGLATFLVGQTPVTHAAFWRGTAESYEDLSSWLPTDLRDASAFAIGHSGSVAYIGGHAKPPTGQIGVAIMWVSSESAPPTSITLLQGLLVSGGVAEVTQSDNLYYVAKANYNVPRNSPPLEIEVSGVSPEANVTILKFRLEAAASAVPGSQTISLYNYTTNSYDAMDTRALSNGDYKTDVVVTQNASRYVHPVSKAMKAKVSVFPPLSASRTWTYSVDEARWSVTIP